MRRRSARALAWAARSVPAAVLVLAVLTAAPANAQTAQPRDEGVLLEQNFPNPFTPGVGRTIFTFTIPAEAQVRLAVLNLLAQEVAVLVDETRPRGRHRVSWDGLDDKGQPVPAGLYWYKLEVEDRRPLLKRLRVLEAATPPAPAAASPSPAS